MGTIKQNYSNNILTDGKFDATDLTGTIPSGNISGSTVQTIAGDPPAPADGQIWYNSVAQALKARVLVAGSASWAVGGNMNSARSSYSNSGAGTQTSALIFGGQTPGGVSANSEEYNGTSWTEGNNLGTARQWVGGVGTQTSALAIKGQAAFNPQPDTNAVEAYDGTTWTSNPSANKAVRITANFGTSGSAVAATGVNAPDGQGGNGTQTEEWNGSTWSNGNTTNTGGQGRAAAAAAPESAGVIFLGNGPAVITGTEEYNGTTWTSVNPASTGRRYLSGWGTQTACLAYGGRDGPGSLSASHVEEYDGTSWTSGTAAPVAREQQGTATSGTSTSGLSAGGQDISSAVTTTLEYTVSSPAYENQTISTS